MAVSKQSIRWKKVILILHIILTLAGVAFIFGNSLNNGEDSSRQSGRVVQAILKIADFFGIKISNTVLLSHIVRKSAHFLEFAVLGTLSFFTLKCMNLGRIAQIYFGAGFCLLIAACDEYIQTFSVGRSGQVSDVFLDLSGSVTAIALSFLAVFLKSKRKRKKEAEPYVEE